MDKKLFNLPFKEKIKLIQQDKYLDTFVYDKDKQIRYEVLNRKYGFDILINDEEPYLRALVAEQKYKLDILINDKSEYVRQCVAKQGYGLDILISDESHWVRDEVIWYCKKNPHLPECRKILKLYNI